MTQQCPAYEWTSRDKLVYFATLTPFAVAFVGAAILIATISVYWTILLLLIYLLGNFFQAGCCIGCPYRGRYCPALFGIFLANYLSATIYRNREHDQKFFNLNATLAGATVFIILIYCGLLLLTIHWAYSIVFLLLGASHVALFFRKICPKCGYNDTCPGGRIACRVARSDGSR